MMARVTTPQLWEQSREVAFPRLLCCSMDLLLATISSANVEREEGTGVGVRREHQWISWYAGLLTHKSMDN